MPLRDYAKSLLAAFAAMLVMIAYCTAFVASTVVHEMLDPLVIGLIGAAAFFALQLVFCMKARRVSVKLIPLYTIVPILIACALFFGEKSFGAIIVMLLLLVALFYAACGIAAAWIVWLIVCFVRKYKKEGVAN